MTIIHKTVAERDGLDFVLSDDTLDRYGDVIDAKGWDLRNFKKNPIALFGHSGSFPIGNWTNVRVEGNKLVATLKLAAKGTSDRIDELINLVEQGILRAVSVGFRPLESEPIDPKKPYGGQRYTKQELLETSLVSVPANPSALALAKSLNVSDETLVLAFGEHADVKRRDLTATGENADTTSADLTRSRADRQTQAKATKMTTKTLSQRVEEARSAFEAARDAYNAHVAVDEYDLEQATTFKSEMDSRKERLDSLVEAEKALGTQAADNAAVNKALPAAARRPLGMGQKEISGTDLVVRSAVVHTLAKLTGKSVDDVLEQRYPGHEATAIVTKADATVATTTTSGWASELINTATGDFINTLKPDSVFPDLLAMGTGLTFNNAQGAIKLPSRTSATSVNGDFVLEGDPIPVRRLTTTSVTLTPRKMGVISTFTKELAKYSTPAIEGLIRSEIISDTAVTLDSKLLDATAGSTTRPAGLLNGVSAAASGFGGGDYAAFLADIKAVMAPFDTANAGRRMALIMHPAQARSLFLMPGPDGTFGWADRFTKQFTVLTSTSATSGRLIAVDAADFAGAYGGMEFDVSEQATLHMSDAPAELVTAGGTVADPTRSLFQTASIAVRMLLDVTWAMRRSGMVQWIDGVTW